MQTQVSQLRETGCLNDCGPFAFIRDRWLQLSIEAKCLGFRDLLSSKERLSRVADQQLAMANGVLKSDQELLVRECQVTHCAPI